MKCCWSFAKPTCKDEGLGRQPTMLRPLSAARLALAALLCAAGAAAANDLVVGNIASTTNPTARENSANLVLGYTVYFQQINQEGGVRGRPVRMLNKDDGVNPDRMVALTQELIADKEVIALAGFLNTAGLVELMKRNTLVDGKIAMVAPIGP